MANDTGDRDARQDHDVSRPASLAFLTSVGVVSWAAMLKFLMKYYRFFTGMRRFFQTTLSLDDAKRIVGERMRSREQTLLAILDRAVFRNPGSPYRKLFESAGYSAEDVRKLIEGSGVEAALRRLAEDGVYVGFDEFKGRKPIRRKNLEIACREGDFDNPYLSTYLNLASGGTTGRATRTQVDFDFMEAEAVNRMLLMAAYGVFDSPTVIWFPVLPGIAGIHTVFRLQKADRPVLAWFSQTDPRSIRPSLQNRVGTNLIVRMARLAGKRFPYPEYVDLGRADIIARRVRSLLDQDGTCNVFTYPNSAIRIAMASRDLGLDLSGVHFFVAGEPITEAKRNEIQATGAKAIPFYAFSEGGIVAYGCAHPEASDDMHVQNDCMAVISLRKSVEGIVDPVDSLHFTTLLPVSPKILLNVETGDHACLSTRTCGCPMEALGFTEHISGVQSFEKLTMEGMTFMISDLLRIIEETLPRSFGGSSTDYQVEERLDHGTLSFIEILVSPRLGAVDEGEVAGAVLQELKKGRDSGKLMADIWGQAGSIRVKRAEPLPTQGGKILPIRVQRYS